MTANAAHHMAAGTPAAAAGACPACGGPLPDRVGRPGRPAAWCSKACRQTAWRARRAAGTAVDAARQTAGRLPAAHRDLQHLAGELAAALHRLTGR